MKVHSEKRKKICTTVCWRSWKGANIIIFLKVCFCDAIRNKQNPSWKSHLAVGIVQQREGEMEVKVAASLVCVIEHTHTHTHVNDQWFPPPMETCPLFQWKLPTSKTTFSLSLFHVSIIIYKRLLLYILQNWNKLWDSLLTALKDLNSSTEKIKSIGFLLSLVTFQRPVRGSRERVPWLNPILPVSSSFGLFRQMQTHAIWSSCATWRTNDKLQNLRELFYLGNISFLIYIYIF